MNRNSSPRRPPASKFRRLALTHALMMGGDAAMIVALADSLFFDIDLDAARTRVMLFLALSFAPFLFVAPLIGPLIDRMAGGRRLVIQVVAVCRVVLLLLMAQYLDALALFPLVFASLILQKGYVVSKSALVPSTVRSETELVEANAKLGLISGLTGAAAVLPAAALLALIGAPATLLYGALVFAAAFVAATRLAPDVVAAKAPGSEEEHQLHSGRLQLASIAMTVMRANVGFIFFHLAFLLRSQEQGTFWFGLVVVVAALASMLGNAIAPRLRKRVREETMLSGALIMSAGAGLLAAFAGGPVAGVMLAGVVNLSASVGRLSFESVVQRDAPAANQGRAFAAFETRFQLAWALAAFIAVAIQVPAAVGYLIIGIGSAGTLIDLRARGRRGFADDTAGGGKSRGPARRNVRGRSRGRARDPERRSRSEWEPPRGPRTGG